ncbi:MAG: hypothetical protein A2X11_16035 [Bacteroidetes bacterium GWE2_42_24]|nr:MAG: hypothetical protein A2X11_16035 [Bacteroidetes bacterium GWE2_42_24]OFY29321.1 MAG: hypothetical protein A2X09_05805 [Bacteroidetes bacterium GWF2_43_11]
MNQTDQQTYIAKTLHGLEPVLVAELAAIGASNISTLKRAVSFNGNKEVFYKANYLCRTALRILRPVASFAVESQEDLYVKVKELPWHDWMTVDNTFAIDAVVSNSVFTHSQFTAQRVKDAIADHWREVCGRRPDVELQNPDLRINLHLSGNEASLAFDGSGEPLFKRGYRLATGEAPLNEILASGILLLAGYDGSTPLHDPMCGSGTLLTEAAMIAQNIPAGYYREVFGFMKWPDFDEDLWQQIKDKADDQLRDQQHPITGSDLDATVVEVAQGNLRSARLHKDISLMKADFMRLPPPGDSGILVMNPPYGERMKQNDIVSFYQGIGDALKRNWSGWTAWIITSDLSAMKFIGLKPSQRFTLFNGPLECRLSGYELFSGARRDMLASRSH